MHFIPEVCLNKKLDNYNIVISVNISSILFCGSSFIIKKKFRSIYLHVFTLFKGVRWTWTMYQ